MAEGPESSNGKTVEWPWEYLCACGRKFKAPGELERKDKARRLAALEEAADFALRFIEGSFHTDEAHVAEEWIADVTKKLKEALGR